MLVFIANYLAF